MNAMLVVRTKQGAKHLAFIKSKTRQAKSLATGAVFTSRLTLTTAGHMTLCSSNCCTPQQSVHAHARANQGSSIRTIPASCASDRNALTVDQTQRRGQIKFNELQRHSRETGCVEVLASGLRIQTSDQNVLVVAAPAAAEAWVWLTCDTSCHHYQPSKEKLDLSGHSFGMSVRGRLVARGSASAMTCSGRTAMASWS